MSRAPFLAILALCVAPVAHGQVQASLVSATKSVQPGQPMTVALRLEHSDGWHTFWTNAGIGYPTRLAWQLPPGWRAGAIQWPTPVLIRDAQGAVTGQGYEGLTYLPVMLAPPASARPGERVTLRAAAEWLMCSEVCVPGRAELTLSLPLSDRSEPDTPVSAALAHTPIPAVPHAFLLAATRDHGDILLSIAGSGRIIGPHFFPQDELIHYDQPQTLRMDEGALRLTLPARERSSSAPERLLGVFGYTDPGGTYRGLKIDVPVDEHGLPGTRVNMVSATSPVAAPTLTAELIGLAILGGVALNLMPCVFPVLAIKIMSFVNQAGDSPRRTRLHGAAYGLGVLACFWALAGILGLLRHGGEALGWGFQLQSPQFVFLLAATFVVFALNLSGAFEVSIGLTLTGSGFHRASGYSGSFVSGLIATLVATPCSAPFLAPALGAALVLRPGQSVVLFTAIAIGLSMPYVLLSAFPPALRLLPKPGPWVQTFRQLMAFPLYATAAYLAWVLAGETTNSGSLDALIALVLIAMSVWAFGRFQLASSRLVTRRLALLTSLVLAASGLVLGWPSARSADELQWEPWSPERLVTLRREDRPILVDFTARWCATCQANKRIAFGSSDVRSYVLAHHVALVEADWTNSDPRVTAELSRWHRAAIPFDLVFQPAAQSPTVLPEILTPAIVLKSLEGR